MLLQILKVDKITASDSFASSVLSTEPLASEPLAYRPLAYGPLVYAPLTLSPGPIVASFLTRSMRGIVFPMQALLSKHFRTTVPQFSSLISNHGLPNTTKIALLERKYLLFIRIR